MSDINNEEKKKSVKNIYDGSTGFSIMINLYVIKYIYYHIDKARCFIDEDERGIKKKSIPIYSTPYFPVSRQRLNRINKGIPFEITQRESTSITEAYGIDIKYFRKDDPIPFKIKDINDTDWKCFYNSRYLNKYELPAELKKGSDKEIKKRLENIANKVETALKELAINWETMLKRGDPLFAVCHYFHYGVRFDNPNIIESLKECLKGIPYSKWDEESIESLNEIKELLREHYTYVSSLVTLAKLRNKQQEKNRQPKKNQQPEKI